MKLTSRATILVALITAAVLVPAVAFGAFSRMTSNPGNTVTAGVLKAPGTLTATAHVLDSATNKGDATLTWNDGLSNPGGISPSGYLIEREAAGSTQWQTLATPAYAGVCNASHICTFTDTTAAFNTTYSYRVSSTVSAWTAGPTNVRLAASIAPSAAEDRQMYALNSVAQSGTGLIAVGQGGRIVVCSGTCTGNASWQAATSPTSNDLYRVVFDASASGRAWAAGANGTLLTCASGCTSTSATWTSVNAGTSASLYGIFADSGGPYVAVVGASLTMRYSVDASFASWASGTVSAGTATTTLYGIAGKNKQNLVIVGSRGSGTNGVIAACSTNGGNVCGGTAFTPVGYATGTTAPAADMRDVGYGSGTGNNEWVYAVGTAGNVYAAASLTSSYTRQTTGSSTDLYGVAVVGQNTVGAVGDPVVPGSSVFIRCTANCATTGPWSAGADTATTFRLNGIAGSGSTYWAVGSGGTIRYFNGSSWTSQSAPAGTTITTVSPALTQTNDGASYALATTAALSAACTAPALVATATVPARSSAAVTTPTVKVTVGYSFTTGANSSQVSLSTNGGSTWSTATVLTANVSSNTAKTVDFTGTVPASDSAQQVLVCIQGAAGGGTMNVDMVHVDVDE